jgi:hypothetical protein
MYMFCYKFDFYIYVVIVIRTKIIIKAPTYVEPKS